MRAQSRGPRLLAICGALAGLVMLTGCSTLRVAYSFADGMLVSRAETYLDLSAEEAARLEAQSAALVAWHRRKMLPKYAAFFRAQADIANGGGWDRAQLTEAFAAFRRLVDETVEGASPFVAEVLVDQSAPAKLAHLKTRMAEINAERRAEYAGQTPAQIVERWSDSRVERISRFTGTLDEDQIAMIRDHSARGADLSMRWLDNRTRRQDALLAFLRTGPTTDETARFVYRILVHGHEIVDPDYRNISEARWRRRADMYYAVLTSLSDEQRRDLGETLRDYAADMVRLAGV